MKVANRRVIGTLYLANKNKHGGWQDEVYCKLDWEASWGLAGKPVTYSGVGECDTDGVAGTTAGEQIGLGSLSAAEHGTAGNSGKAQFGPVADRSEDERPSRLGADADDVDSSAGKKRIAGSAVDVQRSKIAGGVFVSAVDGVVLGGSIGGLAVVGTATRGAFATLGAGLAALGESVVAQWRARMARARAFVSLFVACIGGAGQRRNGDLGDDGGVRRSKASPGQSKYRVRPEGRKERQVDRSIAATGRNREE